MAKQAIDKDTRKAILEARRMSEDSAKADIGEAETTRRIVNMFATIGGYERFKHLTQEYAIRGAGETTHCDIAVLINGDTSKPALLVECKRINIDLTKKHLGQAVSYAINHGCEWVLLTNMKDWKLYHVTFTQPPETKLIESWNLLNDEIAVLTKKFEIIGYKNIKNRGLDILWQKRNVLTPSNMLKAILSEEALKLYQRRLKRATGIGISPEDIVSQFRYLLNESALSEMDKIKISLPARQQRTKTPKAARNKIASVEQGAVTQENQTNDQGH